MIFANLLTEELRAVHLTEDDDLPEEWRHMMNALLSRVETAVTRATTRMLQLETKEIENGTHERQLRLLKDHAVGSH